MIRILAGLGAGLVLWGEFVNWRASRALTHPDHGGPEAVVVFGYRNRHPSRANAVNRWRVRAALRSLDDPFAGRLIACGGSIGTVGVSEAGLLAEYARARGFAGDIVLDELSRSTWANVRNAIALMGDVQRLKFVSNPLHGYKARLYLHAQRPDLAERLVRARDYRFGEWAPLKPLAALYGLVDNARARRAVGRSEETS